VRLQLGLGCVVRNAAPHIPVHITPHPGPKERRFISGPVSLSDLNHFFMFLSIFLILKKQKV
jgi:hypothetical protein